MVKQAQTRSTCDLDAQWGEIQRRELKLEGERASVKKAMREIGVSDLIREMLEETLTFERTIDLFDEPLVRERCRWDILRCKAAEPAISEPEIRKRLKPAYCDKAITDALALQSLMDQQGRADPYDLVREPIDDCPKLRRHLHSQYRFQP
ncbi:MAG: hypothetical protein IT427_07910, partial [Pirellulales bacterium]|nr:hypothetical protein [Pirellulales bacterium]